MTYKYKHFIEAGVNGYTIHAKMEEADTALGILDGWHLFTLMHHKSRMLV